MIARPSLKERLAFAYKRFQGVPIEVELAPYESIALAARGIDLSGAAQDELRGRARRLRQALTDVMASPSRTGDFERRALAECIALAAEACRRGLGIDPYEQQLVAAAAMCAGKVVQLQTGEGKTLAAAIAACYCAMRDGRVHLITANDYLARRDSEWMRPIYGALGLSVASISGSSTAGERRSAYRSDIAYLTARELGFDYLRDGLAYSMDEIVQLGFSSAIVDEADFILIDEARVPLVIAGGSSAQCGGDPSQADRVARGLVAGIDYDVDPEGRRVSLTLRGQERVEAAFGAGGMHEAGAAPLFARVHAALHAWRLLERDVDYLVKEGGIRLVDSFTGRVAERRQWPWGVQAALEAKEGLAIGPEGRVYGSIAVQHLMGLFPRIAAMTATAAAAAEELHAVYGMGTVVVPPVRPSARRDEPDAVFATRAAKTAAVVAEVAREHGRGRPVLAGTASVLESDELAAALRGAGVPCVVLNARNDEEEAGLVAAAGRRGAVTISTNMAGRGTDIKLDEDPRIARLGGLYVIGTNRHDSRRTDDQLRGRAGRQGDPGLTRFFVSLEDPLFARYGDGALAGAGASARAGREIERAQAVIAGRNSAIRRSLRKYSLLVEYERRYARELRDEAIAAGDRSLLARIDAAWADHLALVEDVKEGLGLFRYGGREPGLEFVRIVGEAFEAAMGALEGTATGAAAESGAAAEPGAEPAERPSSTWTYVAEEDALPGFAFALGSLFRAR